MKGKLVAALVLGGLLWPSDAHAYLDPATSSMVLQVLVGGFVAGLAALRMFWARIKAAFGRPRPEPPPAQDVKAD